MFYRKALDKLHAWKSALGKKNALRIVGARQIGKTTVVRELAKTYKSHILFNFVEDPKAKEIFAGSLDAQTLIERMSAYSGVMLHKGQSLIVFDEIQQCPRARTAIKFLVEEWSYDYIETGSLLGAVERKEDSIPVGFEEEYRMYPMDFDEFLLAINPDSVLMKKARDAFDRMEAIDSVIHDKLMSYFRLYMVVGGMPAVVKEYCDSHDLVRVRNLQKSIIELYRQDISQYASPEDKVMIRTIFDSIPSQLGSSNRRFIVSKIGENIRMRKAENAFLWITDAGVALPCYNTQRLCHSLVIHSERTLFKLFLCDPGLLCAMGLQNVQFELLNEASEVDLGYFLENVVAVALKSLGFEEFYYFDQKKYGEIDFAIEVGKEIIPIEVKSGNTFRRHATLDKLLAQEEWPVSHGIVLTRYNYLQEGDITYMPFYMVYFLKPKEVKTFIYEL